MIRNSSKVIIFHDQNILLIENKYQGDHWYTLPGGGQEKFETLVDAATRECMEETGMKVRIKNLAFIREYIGKNHEFSDVDSEIHQIEYMFEGEYLVNETERNIPLVMDKNQVDHKWIKIKDFKQIKFYPQGLKEPILNLYNDRPVENYYGDMN